MTGEREDTEVGFPGPEHHIAERSWPMWAAMAVLGVGALIAGVVQIPGVTEVIERFFEGTFEGSPLFSIHPSDGAAYTGLLVGGLTAIVGIALAWQVYVARPGVAPAARTRLSAVHTFLVNKWYFDELIDAVVVRPALATGRFASDVFERYVVQGLVGGTTGVVRGASVAVRAAQSGYLRSYALLLVSGFAGLALYFLIAG
jgi:NADH-quinone oxidoreductase subunit L